MSDLTRCLVLKFSVDGLPLAAQSEFVFYFRFVILFLLFGSKGMLKFRDGVNLFDLYRI